jgi:hypothetical protein
MSLLPTLNFDILPTYDSRILGIYDSSDWKHLSSEEAYLDVTTPGKKFPVTKIFHKNKTTIYNSATFELTCTDCQDDLIPLPDGLYHFKLFICEGSKFSIEKYHLRTVKLLARLDQILIDADFGSCNPHLCNFDHLVEIDLMLKGAHANIRFGNIEEGMIIYNKVLDKVKQLETCADVPNLRSR